MLYRKVGPGRGGDHGDHIYIYIEIYIYIYGPVLRPPSPPMVSPPQGSRQPVHLSGTRLLRSSATACGAIFVAAAGQNAALYAANGRAPSRGSSRPTSALSRRCPDYRHAMRGSKRLRVRPSAVGVRLGRTCTQTRRPARSVPDALPATAGPLPSLAVPAPSGRPCQLADCARRRGRGLARSRQLLTLRSCSHVRSALPCLALKCAGVTCHPPAGAVGP